MKKIIKPIKERTFYLYALKDDHLHEVILTKEQYKVLESFLSYTFKGSQILAVQEPFCKITRSKNENI